MKMIDATKYPRNKSKKQIDETNRNKHKNCLIEKLSVRPFRADRILLSPVAKASLLVTM